VNALGGIAYLAAAAASLAALVSVIHWRHEVVEWDRRVRRKGYDKHPLFVLGWNPHRHPTPSWFWVPLAGFLLVLTVLFLGSAVLHF
jgi:hypothetical protein